MMPHPATNENEALVAHIRNQHEAIEGSVAGLTDEQARQAPSASALTLIGLVNHVTVVQRDWLRLLKLAPNPPAADDEESDPGFDVPADTSLADVVAAFREVNDDVLEFIASMDLDVEVPLPGDAPWFPEGLTGWQSRSIGHHLLQETARHAGHADILRESIDGMGAYALEYVRRGEEIPAWLSGEPGDA